MNGESHITKVFIVAALPISRAGLEAILKIEANIAVTGSAAALPPASSVFSGGPATFDVLLVNVERRRDFDRLSEFISDEGESGGDGAAASSPFPVIALLSPEYQNARQIVQLLRGGVRGILPSDAAREEITAAINAAANDLIVAAPEVLDALFVANVNGNFSSDEENGFEPDEPLESLTAREREVLEMLTEGASNKSIADRMNISEHTVKFHVASIFGKLDVTSRTEAVTAALRRGLILL